MKSKIGILGGSFNPVHNGHISLATQLCNSLNLDKVMFIPTNIPPHKKTSNLASNQDRLNMLKLAVQCDNRFCVNDIEYKLGNKSYTYNTMLELKEIYKDTQFYFFVGSDMFKIFNKWYNYQKLLEMFTLVVASRYKDDFNNLQQLAKLYPSDKVIVKNIEVLEVSSTQIRENIKNNLPVKHLLPEKMG